MADHLREQIMAATVAAITGLTTTGSHVFRDRDTEEKPLQAAELPGLTIEDDGESDAIASLGVVRLLDRVMRVRITAHVKASSGYSTLLNTILKELEVALSNAAVLGGARYATLVQADAREQSAGAEKQSVRQTFQFDFHYMTAHNAPDVAS